MTDPIELPTYQAQGYVLGVLERTEQGDYLRQPNGQRLRVSSISTKLKRAFEKSPPDEQPRVWSVYPRTQRDGRLYSLMLSASPAVERPLGFTVSGQVVYVNEAIVVLSIHRNQPPPVGKEQHRAWNPFLITVHGHLPELRWREHWCIQCELTEDRLRILEGEKVADASPRPRQPQAGDVPAPAEQTVPPAPESPPPTRPKRVFDLSRRL